ncbi:MAG TPA: response regulator transcription factor [Solirubrobacteraceae bacterium]|nr:response regulator transcription factor [Solirubrobacteraceae bacterium]
MQGRTDVIIGSREPITAMALRLTCAAEPDLEPVGPVESLEGLMTHRSSATADQVALVDPGVLGAEPDIALQLLKGSGLRPLLFAERATVGVLPELLRAGACGFVARDASPQELVGAVRLVAAGRLALSDAVQREVTTQLLSRHDDAPVLTVREREVLALVSEGRSSANIGERLHVSERTVKTHIARASQKLGTTNRTAAVVRALKQGLL